MTTDDPTSVGGAPRGFYEHLADRALHPHAASGIAYRNHVVARRIGSGSLRVLEVGPGEGGLTRLLAARGHRVVATDLARRWLARVPVPAAGKVGSEMTALPFADRTFDAVVAAEVLEHIPDLPRALGEAARVLVPGGRLVVTVPYRETLNYVSCPHCGTRFEVNGHVHTFQGEDLARALTDAGLVPRGRFVGSTRFARELARRLPPGRWLSLLMEIDRLGARSQRVSDTWLLMAAVRPDR